MASVPGLPPQTGNFAVPDSPVHRRRSSQDAGLGADSPASGSVKAARVAASVLLSPPRSLFSSPAMSGAAGPSSPFLSPRRPAPFSPALSGAGSVGDLGFFSLLGPATQPAAPARASSSGSSSSAAAAPLPFDGIPRPDPSAFQGVLPSQQLTAARARAAGGTARPTPPPTPQADRGRNRSKDPFLARLEKDEAMIRSGATPFSIDVGGGQSARIASIDLKPFKGGQYSIPYLCEVEGRGRCVLKVFNKGSKDRALHLITNQLLLYTRNRLNPNLSSFIPPYFNFDPHLEAIKEIFLDNELDQTRYRLTKEYVQKNGVSSVRMMSFIPNDFPVDTFDRNHPIWIQLKKLIASDHCGDHYVNDILLDNIKLDDQGKLWLIDLMEEECEDDLLSTKVKRTKSFTDVQEQVDWLMGKEGSLS